MTLIDHERQIRLRVDIERYDLSTWKIFLPRSERLTETNTDQKHLKRLIILEEIEKMPLIMLSIVVHIHLVSAMLAENFFESQQDDLRLRDRHNELAAPTF